MVRRLKSDVLTELPPKRYSVVELEANTPALLRAIQAEQSAREKADSEKKRLKADVARAKRGGDIAAHRAAVANLRDGVVTEGILSTNTFTGWQGWECVNITQGRLRTGWRLAFSPT